MKIYYSQEEKVSLLEGVGYKVVTVPSYDIGPNPFNETRHVDVMIAYLPGQEPEQREMDKHYYHIKSQWGIDVVFESEFKKRLNKLLWTEI